MNYIWVDEAWRWPWAWPVIAWCCVFLKSWKFKKIRDLKKILKDSKKLSEKKREEIYKILKNLKEEWFLDYEYKFISAAKIDKYWIKESNRRAMRDSLKKILKRYRNILSLENNKKVGNENFRSLQKIKERNNIKKIRKEDLIKTIIIDWNDNYKFNFLKKYTSINLEFLIRWDDKIPEIQAASIVAKVMRDRLMIDYSKKYKHYWFDLHKWYWTKLHSEMLNKLWVCKIHRKTFKPVKLVLDKEKQK